MFHAEMMPLAILFIYHLSSNIQHLSFYFSKFRLYLHHDVENEIHKVH